MGKQKVLITGGNGFIGSAILKELISRGFGAVSISRGFPSERIPGVKYLRGDISDYNSMAGYFRNIDTVFHVAAMAGAGVKKSKYYRVNVEGTKNVIKGCELSGVRNLIFTSSASVVFDRKSIRGGNELLPYPSRPQSAYQETKIIAENLILKANSGMLRTISLRPHIVWGPGDPHFMPGIIGLYKSGKLRLLKNRNPYIDTTYITNCALAHILALEALEADKRVDGKAFFISDDSPVRLYDFILCHLKLIDDKSEIKYLPYFLALCGAKLIENVYRSGMIKSEPRINSFIINEMSVDHWFNISAAKTQLKYVPLTDRTEGLKQLKEAFYTSKGIS